MSTSNRVIAVYIAWGVTAFGATLSWATNGIASVNGLTSGLNGGMVIILGAATIGLVAWWDRGSRFDGSQLKMALFAAALAISVLLRNAYNINNAGLSIGWGLWVSTIFGFSGLALIATLPRR